MPPDAVGAPGAAGGTAALYRERYLGFNVRQFYEIAVREHGVTTSCTAVKRALQEACLVRKRRARGRRADDGARIAKDLAAWCGCVVREWPAVRFGAPTVRREGDQ